MLNKALIIGHTGADVELRYTQAGKAVGSVSVATVESWKDADGSKQEETTWHRVVMWGKRAEFAAEYIKKGGKVFVEGKTVHRKWPDQQGNDRYTTEIVADRVENLSPKSDGRSSDYSKPSFNDDPPF